MINFAVIGTSHIVEVFLQACADIPEINFYAVYSRDRDRGRQFAEKHGAEVSYDSLEKLAADPLLDAVYIASPNASHCSQAVFLMNAGKHVLVEKSIASNTGEFMTMQESARKNQVILLEEIRFLHDPGFRIIKENLKELGEIRQAIFQFCQYSSRYDNFKKGIIENAFKPELSNGALMDIGVYCIHFLAALFGMPDKIQADSIFLENNIDGAGSITANYKNKMQVQLIYSKITTSSLPSQIMGEEGIMVIDKLADPRSVKIRKKNGEEINFPIEKVPVNMYYAVKAFANAVNGKESVEEYLKYSQYEMLMSDEARKQTGIVFPADKV